MYIQVSTNAVPDIKGCRPGYQKEERQTSRRENNLIF